MGCGVSVVVLRNAISKNTGVLSVVPCGVIFEPVTGMSGALLYRQTAEG